MDWLEFKKVEEESKRECIAKATQAQLNTKWQPPIEGIYRINTDTAISTQMARTGKEIVARNCKGEIIKAQTIEKEKKEIH